MKDKKEIIARLKELAHEVKKEQETTSHHRNITYLLGFIEGL